jgi:uncharacterized protein YktA (UPF0223 family)
MGHSTSFPEMTTSGQQMDTYIQSRNKGLIADMKPTRDDLENTIANAFTSEDKPLISKASDEVYDWRQSDVNNLDVIAKSINQVAKSVMTGLTSAELLPESVIVGIATTCITDVMGLFTTRTSASYSSGVRQVSLSPGLKMFAASVSMELEDKQIFNTGTLVASWIVYKVVYSNNLSKSEAKEKILNEIHQQLDDDLSTITIANKTINDYERKILTLDPDDPDAIKYQHIIDRDKKVLHDMTEMVNDLSKQIDDTKTMLLLKK